MDGPIRPYVPNRNKRKKYILRTPRAVKMFILIKCTVKIVKTHIMSKSNIQRGPWGLLSREPEACFATANTRGNPRIFIQTCVCAKENSGVENEKSF